MTRKLGPSIALSFLIVGVFAVALYQPETKGVPAGTDASTHVGVSATDRTKAPAPTPGVPLVESDPRAERPLPLADESPKALPAPNPSEAKATRPIEVRPVGYSHQSRREVVAPTEPSKPRRSAPRGPRKPVASRRTRTAFTQVGQEESLAEVALRVYGSTDAARALWLANRDILTSEDAHLHSGMLLRTP